MTISCMYRAICWDLECRQEDQKGYRVLQRSTKMSIKGCHWTVGFMSVFATVAKVFRL